MRTYRSTLILTVAVAMVLCVSMAHAAGASDITTIAPTGTLTIPDGLEGGLVNAISSAGKMAGFCFDSDDKASPYTWPTGGGSPTLLNGPDGVLNAYPYGTAVGINSAGNAIGYVYSGNGNEYGFFSLTALGKNGTDESSIPCAVNDANQVDGYSYSVESPGRHGFLWENFTMTPLTWTHTFTDNGQNTTINYSIVPADAPIRSINDAGQIVGSVSDYPLGLFGYNPVILWDNGVATELNPGVGGTNARINEAGQVVADSASGGVWLYTPGQGVRDLNVSSQYPTDSDNPDTAFGSAHAIGFNDLGQVLIEAHDVAATPAHRLFVWQDDGSADGSFTEIPLSQLLEPGDSLNTIYAHMNSMGQVAGSVEDISANFEGGFFWDPRKPGSLEILGGGSGELYSIPTAINDLGVIAGYTNSLTGCFWDTRLAPTELGLSTGYTDSYAVAINDSDQVVGYCPVPGTDDTDAVAWQNGVMTTLPLPEGDTTAMASDINASGQVVGVCAATPDLQDGQPCQWELVDGAWTETTLQLPEGYTTGMMFSINDAGQMIGQCQGDTTPSYAAYFQNGPTGTPTVLLYNGSPINPSQMNASGQVVGIVGADPSPVVVWNPDGTVTEVATGGQTASINDLGQVAGALYDTADSQYKSFLYLPAAAYGMSAGLYTSPADTSGWYYAINDAGLVFAGSESTVSSTITTKVWFKDLATGTTHYLGTLPGKLDSSSWLAGPVKINSSGVACGCFTYTSTEMDSAFYASIQDGLVFLGTLGANDCSASDINDSGVIAGDAGHSVNYLACTWQTALNHPPVADAGPDQSVTVGADGTATVTLDGSGSSDPDGDVLSYAWSENGAQIATGVNPTVSLGVGTHTIVLTVTDPYGASSQDQLTVTVSALGITDVTPTSPSSYSPLVTVTVVITNPSATDTDYNVTVTAASLGGVETNSALPLVYGAIKPGTSKQCTLQFKNVPSGDQTLTVQGTSSLGDFSIEQTVTAP